MNIKTASSKNSSPSGAVAELQRELQSIAPKMVLYFASSHFDPESLAKAMQEAFPSATVFGCSTAGEIVSGAMLKNSVVAMGFNANVIADVAVEVMPEIAQQSGTAVPQAFARLEKHFGTSMRDLDSTKHVGIVLIDGLSGSEEAVMEKIGDLTDVFFVGGSAGDDLKFQGTYVYANGKAYTNAALLALVKPACKFAFIKTASFKPTGCMLTPTKVDPVKRQVLEFDNRPAAAAYAGMLGTSVEDLPKHFMNKPLGLMSGNDPYVRSPQRVADGSVLFYCGLREGMPLEILEGTNIIEDTKKAIEDEKAKLGGIQGLINFHCILRTLDLEARGETEAYAKLFTTIPTIGFSTYGEEFLGHVNQTSVMLCFQ